MSCFGKKPIIVLERFDNRSTKEGFIPPKNRIEPSPVKMASNVHIEKKSFSPVKVKTEGNSSNNNCRIIVDLVRSVKSEHDVTTFNSVAIYQHGTGVDSELSERQIKVEPEDVFTLPIEASVLAKKEREYQTNIIHDLVSNCRAISSGKCEDYECENVNFCERVIHNDTSESKTNESHCEGGRFSDFRGSDFTITADENLSIEHKPHLNSNTDGSQMKLLDATVVHENVISKNTRKPKTAENKSHCEDDRRPVFEMDAVSMLDSENPSIEPETHSRRIVDWSQMKFLCVSVALVDLFSDSARKRGEGHINDRACSCIYCQGKFKLSDVSKKQINCQELDNHNRNAMKPSGPDCAAKLNDDCHLPRHSRLNPKEKQLLSTKCHKTFKREYDLQGHYSSNKKFTFADCGAKFKVKQSLISHMVVHRDEKPFSCHTCPLKLKRKRSLIQHLAVHRSDSEKKYSCAHCSAKFKVKGGLTDHMKVHIDDKPFSCNMCPLKFKRKITLKSHLTNIHSSEKKYSCAHCPAKFKLEKALQRHLSGYSGVQLFKCTHCPAIFKMKHSLEKHSLCHIGGKLECAHCLCRIIDKTHMIRHIRELHSTNNTNNKLLCTHCSVQFNKISGLILHIAHHHAEIKVHHCCMCAAKFKDTVKLKYHLNSHYLYSCSKCPGTFSSRRTLTYHNLVVHTEVKAYSCSVCSATFSLKRMLKYHMVSHNGERKYSCSLCPIKFSEKSDLSEHLKRHAEAKKFSCTKCLAKFVRKDELDRHLLTRCHEKRFACSKCSFIGREKGNLLKHILIHSERRPFSCPYCSATFKAKKHLTSHITLHSDERPFGCAMCTRKFKVRCDLVKHFRTHSDEKPFACLQCPAKFKRNSHLKDHVTIHSNEKPFACAQCPAKFRLKHILQLHLKRHFGEKRFGCSFCSYKFVTQQELKGHELTHKEKKAVHACTSCPLMFKSKLSLDVHRRIHTNERPFSCEACPCRFRSASSLRYHMVFQKHTSEKLSCTV